MDLPARLEQRLKRLIPRKAEREKFVAAAVDRALLPLEVRGDAVEAEEVTALPQAVGGTLHLYSDGGSRGNPGEAAVGCVIRDPISGAVLRRYRERIGIHTNNVAEYEALIAGLKIAKQYLPNRLVCHLDSELVVKQLKGEYRVRMPSLQPLLDEILSLAKGFPDVVYQYIPREANREADRLVNEALDGK